jgi:alpha-glucuronidase
MRLVLTISMKKILILLCFISITSFADDGSRLWLKYDLIQDSAIRNAYIKTIKKIVLTTKTESSEIAAAELKLALKGMIGKDIAISHVNSGSKTVQLIIDAGLSEIEKDGFKIQSGKRGVKIIGKTDIGLLYGTFAFIRQLQTLQDISDLSITENPKVQIRMLNHWDNADGTVERGYAGSSIWKWSELPETIDARLIQYARANAAIGINAVSINNVNASSRFLTAEYLRKIKGVADMLRPYGIKVFISVNFKSPKTLGGIETSDPLDEKVRSWWIAKTDEIHTYIPDFGGYLVKANSEGEPGPQDYGRTHADGANMLADALKNRNGIVIWRAFVYNADIDGDRFQEAFNQFKPLDGKFDKKVIVQVKNGPIDFMPREPFHPMFGAFTKTPLAMEFQITQEYLGQSTHLTYLAPMFKETLDAKVDAIHTVAQVMDGSKDNFPISIMAGVANTGSDVNWTRHPFNQANWYAFGRLAWNYELSSEQIAKEWTAMTLTKAPVAIDQTVDIMMESLPTYIEYTYPLGLHHMMGEGHHYGPQPWLEKSGRPDWTSVYYHRAGLDGIGFDRTGKMSNALSLYAPEIQAKWNNPATMDLNYLLWFHHLSWDYKLSTGKTLWDELMIRYYKGPEDVKKMQVQWDNIRPYIDAETFNNVASRLAIQQRESIWWRDACYLYFKEFAKRPLPAGLKEPNRTLDDVKEIEKIYHLR